MNRSEYSELKKRYEIEGRNVVGRIADVILGTKEIDIETAVSAAYVLYQIKRNGANAQTLDDFCKSTKADEDRRSFLENTIGHSWQMTIGQKDRYHEDTLLSIIFFYEDRGMRFGGDRRTAASISRLAVRLFELENQNEIADFGSGVGSFLIESFFNNPSIQEFGVECDPSSKEIAKIRLELLGSKAIIKKEDIFNHLPGNGGYENIFSNFPFGDKNAFYKSNKTAWDKSGSSDWYYLEAIVDCLKPSGKGIAVMSPGGTWNKPDALAREYFIKKGLIKAVIALPERMLDYSNISTVLVVLNKKEGEKESENERVMMVDATNLCEKGRRENTLTDEQIEMIADAVSRETEFSRLVSKQELRSKNYVINPTRFFLDNEDKNGMPLGQIIRSQTRGVSLSASELDELETNEDTDYYYLTLSDIQKEGINDHPKNLKYIEDRYKKYCVKNRSLILSRNGWPLKMAVAEVESSKKILATGNMFVIEINEEIADPYYIKMFLESQRGSELLNSYMVGTVIHSVNMDALENLRVPLIPLEEQQKMAEEYKQVSKEIKKLKEELNEANERLSSIFERKEKMMKAIGFSEKELRNN